MVTPLAASAWRRARWLVLAPHPDDETLGAAALIAEVAAAGRLAAIAYLTDGTGSHPDGGPALASARRGEARLAIQRLGGGSLDPIHLDWRDASPPASDTREFNRARDLLAATIRRLRIDAVAVTAAHEPHCDHEAAHDLARATAKVARRAVTIFEYCVWGDPVALGGAPRYRTAPLAPGRRRAALAAHRSQTGPRFGGGFRLPPAAWRMPATDLLHRRTNV